MVPPIDGEKIVSVEAAKEAIKTKKITEEEAKFIAQALAEIEQEKVEENNPCPYPNRKEYAKIREKLSPDQQKKMQANIGKKDADGKIEMFLLKKKFSILQAEHNGKDIFKGEHEDKNGNKGIKGVTYLTGRAAEKVCEEQNKKILNGRAEVEQFIGFFPGESIKEKIFNFVQLFGLEKAGYWISGKKEWTFVGSVGYVGLSRVFGNDGIYGATWNGDSATIVRDYQGCPSPFVACEDCSSA